MDEIIQQARQGSMAALIQLMNEKLADVGIRTRAMFAEGVLQVLCEAATVDQLEQTQLVERLRTILEEFAPRNFRRIRINARIAREEQLLWLDEISRDPQNQLLWSEEIKLTPPNWLQQLGQQFQAQKRGPKKQKLDKSLLEKRSRPKAYRQGLVGGAILSLLMVGGLWSLLRWRSLQSEATQLIRADKPAFVSATPTANALKSSPSSDPFAEAIRLAEYSSIQGQTAKTAAEWLDLAAKWQRASELMKSVPKSDARYETAQERGEIYRRNSEMAQKHAQSKRSP
jgi:hypothetical protein